MKKISIKIVGILILFIGNPSIGSVTSSSCVSSTYFLSPQQIGRIKSLIQPCLSLPKLKQKFVTVVCGGLCFWFVAGMITALSKKQIPVVTGLIRLPFDAFLYCIYKAQGKQTKTITIRAKTHIFDTFEDRAEQSTLPFDVWGDAFKKSIQQIVIPYTYLSFEEYQSKYELCSKFRITNNAAKEAADAPIVLPFGTATHSHKTDVLFVFFPKKEIPWSYKNLYAIPIFFEQQSITTALKVVLKKIESDHYLKATIKEITLYGSNKYVTHQGHLILTTNSHISKNVKSRQLFKVRITPMQENQRQETVKTVREKIYSIMGSEDLLLRINI